MLKLYFQKWEISLQIRDNDRKNKYKSPIFKVKNRNSSQFMNKILKAKRLFKVWISNINEF